ncbi:MAG: prepilin-type N-terminal cleavage/methylation domain-containing protein [Candidatus Hinthialibacter antarcticus]|nr:prepilin-type N-terminal cleavage/methylation domain-containing protein [Candidatus Hinthialibacter antarcticus]
MKQSGFTLIELLIVVAIIGILAAIAVPNFLNAQIRAKVARCVSDMKTLETALEMYQMDAGDYPPYGGQTPNVRRWYVLTSPIAYISSIPIDPFFSDASADAVQWGSAYDITLVNAAKDNYNWDCLWGAHYRINAWGPDARNDWGGCRQSRDGRQGTFGCPNGIPNFQYQVSNGLVSDGDIVWLGPKTGRRTSPDCKIRNAI